MKAVRMYKPGDLRVEDVPVPVPGEGEVLLKVMACGVCGSDIPRVNKYGAHIAPLTIGHEFSAEVVQLGKKYGRMESGRPGDGAAADSELPVRVVRQGHLFIV